jgi:ribosomal protein S18 acetylase RimI-like enzyme
LLFEIQQFCNRLSTILQSIIPKKKMDRVIRMLQPGAALPFDLLLLADETTDAIGKYIYSSDVYVLSNAGNDEPLAVFALYRISATETEIKNIAVSEALQGKGIGSYLIGEIKKIVKQQGCKTLIVGTGDQGAREIRFYERNGFRHYARKEDFFIKNYPRPIIAENGKALKDMVMLKMEL